MTIRKIFYVYSLFLFIFVSIHAFAEENSITLTLDEALRLSLSHPNVEAKKKELGGAIQKVQTSKWLRFPSVSVISQAGQASVSSTNSTVVTTFRVEQPLWAGGRITGSIDSAIAKSKSAQSAVSEVEQDILIKSASAFINYLKFQDKISASKESIVEHQRLLELIERRARNEISPMTEIILAKARLDQAKSENIQLETAAMNAKADLQNYTGVNIKSLESPRIALTLPDSISDAVRLAVEYSPTLKRLTTDSESAEADIETAKASIWPQLNLRSDQNYGGILEGNTTYLALSYTPGNGLSALSNAKEAEAKRDASKNFISSAKLDLVNKINTDWNQHKSDSKQTEVLFNLSQTTKGVYQSYARQYVAGKKTWVEVLNAKKEATQARYSLADYQWNSVLSGIKIQVYTGILSESNINISN